MLLLRSFVWWSDVCFEVLSCFFDHPSIDSNKKMLLSLFKGCFEVSSLFLLHGLKDLSVDVTEQDDARRRLRGMCWCKKELPVCWMAMESWVEYATNVCRRDEDVLLRTNTLEDELHIRVPLLLKTKLTSILPPYMLGVWGSPLKFTFPLLMSSKKALPHLITACNVSYFQ